MVKRSILFLILNFGALAIGGLFTSEGVSSDWYQNLNQAPWTPPGWVFGAAWTTIMIFFSIYMAFLFGKPVERKKLVIIYSIQWILNVIWNPIFFFNHEVSLGLFSIFMLTLLVGYMLYEYRKSLQLKSILIAPYLIWLLIATSLNGYILFYN